ncbi:actin binding protein [Sporothrix stenoceras]|uniref:Actin binding protein n=1 Tax=Sporothrix stenoceras TaxID=5173 RepID=A0ABR3YX67_9PEZI
MTSLNLSINGPSIRSSYESVIKAANSTSSSPTDVRWALFSVQAPLANAFQDSGNKESVLKVDGTGSGELDELIEDFSEGRIQFAFVRVKDPNSGLPKNVLIAWCGGGVPERTKGYFTSHLNAVSKVLHGYHVQITARSQDDLEIDTIMKKVSDASGAKYSAGSSGDSGPRSAPPPLAKKPVFTPTSSSSAAHAPLIAARNRRQDNVDADGWGDDAPPVTRTQIEKVESAYKPVKVNMAELTKQRQPEPPRFGAAAASSNNNDNSDVIGGGYKPVGKVDIAAIRAAAKQDRDDRPTIVKGAYEPIGKVDIAAIRAKAQRPTDDDSARPSPPPPSAPTDDEPEPPKSLADRSAAFSHSDSDRLTSLPKPKIANKFGGASAFSGTKAPIPGSGSLGLGAPRPPKPPPVGTASRTFADQGGKTPAQIWAEKKAREGALSGAGLTLSSNVASPPQVVSPLGVQKSGGEWKSGYQGKSWGTVQTSNFGRAGAVTEQHTGGSVDAKSQNDEPPSSPGGGVSALRDRFKGAQPMGQPAPSAPAGPTHTGGSNSRGFGGANDDDDSAPPPPIPSASRPPGAFQLPGLPSRPPPPTDEEEEEQPEEEFHEREQSPVRLAVPVARAPEPEQEEEEPAPPVPAAPRPIPPPVHDEPEPEPEPAREPSPPPAPVPAPAPAAPAGASSGLRALIQYDYEKAEDNEIELVEGQYVTNIDQVDDDWWMGTNVHGETGLFPSNYVELVADEGHDEPAHEAPATAAHVPPPPPPAEPEHEETGGKDLPWAYAQYDYEAGEDNELSFPEGAKVTDIEFPDDDWWFGHYQGQSGLFPSNYVELQQ